MKFAGHSDIFRLVQPENVQISTRQQTKIMLFFCLQFILSHPVVLLSLIASNVFFRAAEHIPLLVSVGARYVMQNHVYRSSMLPVCFSDMLY